MGYASWTCNDNPEDSFIDKQWEEPVILRFNGQECKAFIIVDRDNHTISSDIKERTKIDAPDFTEVEIALPLPTHWNQEQHEALLDRLEKYYKKYKLAKPRTDFSFVRWKKGGGGGGEGGG